MVRSFRDLRIWQTAMDLVQDIYVMTREFPGGEQFGLTSQIRRAAVSVPSNIAEGHARRSTRQYLHFLGIARGSLAEVMTQTELAARLGFAPKSVTDPLLQRMDSLSRQVTTLMDALREKLPSQSSLPA